MIFFTIIYREVLKIFPCEFNIYSLFKHSTQNLFHFVTWDQNSMKKMLNIENIISIFQLSPFLANFIFLF